jgi:CRP/FNR family transcriptional regulator
MQYAARWMNKYPKWTSFVMQLSNMRFEELLDTIDAISFGKLDTRLATYLIEKSKKTNTRLLKITHQTIAEELGSAREVISRLLKQLEKDNKVNLSRGVIEITGLL